MKKILLSLLLVSGICFAEENINPKSDGPFEKGRLVYQMTTGVLDFVVTDLKTGCQFMYKNGYNSGVSLGCFPELIDPKFKK